jgi:uncharacterized integral membrane protein
MRIRVLPVLLVVLLTAAFALINWTTFSTPTALNLGVATVTAPLGTVMLGIVALLGVMYLASVISLQGTALLETRRMARELQAQRELADKAEASRFTELQRFISAELLRVSPVGGNDAAILARLDQLEQRQRLALEETGNTLSAYIGELEDRLERRDGLVRTDEDPVRGAAERRRTHG